MGDNATLIAEVELKAGEIRISPEELARMIDHALLRPEKSLESFRNLCNEAKKYNFYSVCVNPYWVRFCSDELKSTDIKVVAVVSFPFGQMTTRMKAMETRVKTTQAQTVQMAQRGSSLRSRRG